MPDKATKPVFSIQLVRDVVDSSCDGKSVHRTEVATAQIVWDTKDGQPPQVSSGYSMTGEWRVIE